jgi:Outer membrane protein beta-barrel domain
MRMQAVRFVSALVIAAAPCFSSAAAAQSFGGKGGYNTANVSFDQDRSGLSTTAEPSFVVGGFFNLPLFGRFDLQVEGLYSKRVAKFEEIIKDSLTYIEVPMLARYRLMTRPSWRVHVVGGIVYSRLIEARETFSGFSEDITDLIEPNDLAASIGGDVEWKRRWVFDFRYLYGLTEVYAEPGSLFSARHKAIQITAGYRIR